MAEEEFDFTGLYEGECGYFEGKRSHEEIYLLNEQDESGNQVRFFDEILATGFRRTGCLIYRAACPDCKKCVPIRIRSEDFEFNKNQRHLLKKNSDIELVISKNREDLVNSEKIALLKQYNLRHDPDKVESDEDVRNMLLQMNGLKDLDDNQLEETYYLGTINMDYYLNGKLIGVGLIDIGNESLSSNYFYYDTSDEIMKRSIGTFTILREIEFCKDNNIPFYYLGYYLSECRKMNYKGKFLPHELLIDGKWVEQTEQNFNV